jgi:hypothetical protein
MGTQYRKGVGVASDQERADACVQVYAKLPLGG